MVAFSKTLNGPVVLSIGALSLISSKVIITVVVFYMYICNTSFQDILLIITTHTVRGGKPLSEACIVKLIVELSSRSVGTPLV